MAARALPGLGLIGFWDLGQQLWKDDMDLNLRVLSALSQITVISYTTALPGSPSNGDIYIVPDGTPTTGNKIAIRDNGVWVYVAPIEGWQAFARDTDLFLIFDGTIWRPSMGRLGLGGATPDATNRLSLNSAAILLNHAGAGHTAKINKNAASDTASLIFQTNFSGRAEFGLIGDDNFTVKVSPDGTSFFTGISIDKGTGNVGLSGYTADATNGLGVKAGAILFDKDTDHMRVTINKNAAGNDAAMIFQTNFSTRAIFGLQADDQWTVKVSPDGSVFNTALVINQTTALMTGRKGGAVPAVQMSVLTADRTGSDVGTAQAVFGASEDALTVEGTTTYEFEAEYWISRAAGVTSHTTGVLLGGTATFTSIMFVADVANPTGNVLSAASRIIGNVATLTTLTAANVSATENLMITLKGRIRINAAGTIIPQFQFSAAPGGAPTIKANSSFKLWPVGSSTIASVGSNWA